MSGKIRGNATSPRIKGTPAKGSRGCSSDQHPWFSFRYMTTNKEHSLEFLDTLDVRERECTFKGLLIRLDELSHQPWLQWMSMPKRAGLETIQADELTFSPAQGAPVTKDMKLYVFRFDTYQGSGQGRIIGFKSDPCSVYHIIGYDFNFTAYDH